MVAAQPQAGPAAAAAAAAEGKPSPPAAPALVTRADLAIPTPQIRLFPKLGTTRDPASGKPVPTFWNVLNSPQNAGVFRTLILFTVLMFGVPMACFFGAYGFLASEAAKDLALTPHQQLAYSGVASIVGLHLVLGFFIVYAFCIDKAEDEAPSPSSVPGQELAAARPSAAAVVVKEEEEAAAAASPTRRRDNQDGQPRLRSPASRI